MQEIVIPTYRYKEEVLLSVALEGWRNYLFCIDDFSNFSPYYTRAYGEKKIDSITNIRDEFFSAEKKEKEILHSLKTQSIQLCRHWQLLKRYIQGAYPKRFQASKLKVAGKPYYFNAYRFHFESALELIRESSIFLNSYKMLLTLDNNMPGNFVDEYQAVCDQFVVMYQAYQSGKTAEKKSKYDKIRQLNEVKKSLSEMFYDAKAIYATNKEKQLMFSFREQAKKQTTS